VKPEWLDDEKIASCSDPARVLSIALILLADDHGNGRANSTLLRNRVWGFAEPSRDIRESLAELSSSGFVRYFTVNGETYYSIRNWKRHQRVDKAGKPHYPSPDTEGAVYVSGTSLISSGKSRESDARVPGESQDGLAPDLEDDLDHDLEDEGSVRGKDLLEAKASTPPPRKQSGRGKQNSGVLNKHRAEAERLWQMQDQLRRKISPRAIPLKATDERLERVAERLEAGATPEECETVLRHYADRAQSDPSQRQWFNGTTNWRRDNFETALGMAGAPLGANGLRRNGQHTLPAVVPLEHRNVENWDER
jgi:hypothetical protein